MRERGGGKKGSERGRELHAERVSRECTYALEFPSRGRDDGAGNRDFATSILDEAAIFLAVRKKET